jgi:predicted metal-dependent HD superfamily phosphohydrolase
VNTLTQERWDSRWLAAGAIGDPSPWYKTLAAAYGEPHRHYHNRQHIAECLREFDEIRDLCENAPALEFGIWFHDAIYDPKASDNEERSADLAARCLAQGQLDPLFSDRVQQLILVTKTHDPEPGTDLTLMVDIDLAILGSSWDRFAEYEQAIRQEYAWVPEVVLGAKRAAILDRFLSRDRIYSTEWFWRKYEQQARVNLTKSVHNLKGLAR